LDKALPTVTQFQVFQPYSKSQCAKLGCSQIVCVTKEPLPISSWRYDSTC